ncbi:phage tail sheath subtilisin-like domain-containing protein [Sphingomonas sp. SORGH_AS_0438]|uniref:phage tail sheath subtilisin-like domain-containing protein n=1 Tax=Sphingomonas sp. SORGH_AS_0438 TaxID=3041756 RepID=UPI0028622230|nr:phage tail sheath subtilisin-like domain-containing protein [Sphingomonas sp. SORGH_AS_0438]MDR6128055.1 phage tail sheath protein FI [Sphingomonas sp. SORGH_AS_0438]
MHGITITETNETTRSLITVATGVIGMVVTAPDADAAVFPLDRPALIVDIDAAIGAAGTTGTLSRSLRAIADQVRCPVVVVRVAPGADANATNAAVIGTTTNGLKTGMQALLAAEGQVGVRPRILGAPGLDTLPVRAALQVIAQRLRAMVYAKAIGDDTASAIADRANASGRELMLLWPNFLAFDSKAATNVTGFAVAYALGLRAKIDQEEGWHRTLSNVPVNGVIGLTRDVGFDVQDPYCEANLLNDKQITALIRTGEGFRFWGSRTCSTEPLFAFESATRAAQVIQDTIAGGMMWAIDKPLRPSLVKDIVETINGKLRELVAAGQLIGGRAWFDAAKNTPTTLQAGKVVIDYDYTPVPPLENLLLNQRITGEYFQDFAAAVAA